MTIAKKNEKKGKVYDSLEYRVFQSKTLHSMGLFCGVATVKSFFSPLARKLCQSSHPLQLQTLDFLRCFFLLQMLFFVTL